MPFFENHPEHLEAIDDPPSIVPALPAMAAPSRDFESA
jgi:hypothetical protein